MNELAAFFNAFYSQFVLRDFMAKMVPGGVVLLSCCLALSGPQTIIGFAEQAPLWPWIFVAGISWLVGIGIQGLGSKLDYSVTEKLNDQESPKKIEPKKWFNLYVKCKQQLDQENQNVKKQELERLIVLRESTGIGCTALVIATLVLTLDGFIDSGFKLAVWWCTGGLRWLPISIILVFLLISLLVVHAYYVQVQYEFMLEHQPANENSESKSGGNST